MKRILVFVSMLIPLLVACSGGTEDVDEEVANKYISKGEEVVQLINDGNFEKVRNKFNDEMKEELSLEDMEDLTPILEEAGTFDEVLRTSIEKQDEKYVVVIVTKYSEKEIIYGVTFMGKDEIDGLFVQ